MTNFLATVSQKTLKREWAALMCLWWLIQAERYVGGNEAAWTVATWAGPFVFAMVFGALGLDWAGKQMPGSRG